LRQRVGKAVNLNASYVYAFSYNDTDGAFSLPANGFDLASEWGRAADDRRHQLFGGMSVKLPWDITTNTSWRLQSGKPYNITTGFDDNGDSITNDRPAGVDRNSGSGPSFFDMSFNLSKTIRLFSGSSAPTPEGSPESRPMPGAGGRPEAGGRGGPGGAGGPAG